MHLGGCAVDMCSLPVPPCDTKDSDPDGEEGTGSEASHRQREEAKAKEVGLSCLLVRTCMWVSMRARMSLVAWAFASWSRPAYVWRCQDIYMYPLNAVHM